MTTWQVSRLEHSDPHVAAAVRDVMVQAYRVEAEILGARDFFPLQRTDAQIAATQATFLGISASGALVAVAEVESPDAGHWSIGSLVTHPDHFRRGLATAMIRHIIDEAASRDVTVSTGIDNQPALRLYAAHGFRVCRRWVTRDGISMVTLVRDASASESSPGWVDESGPR